MRLSPWECPPQRFQSITSIKEQKLGQYGNMKAKERINYVKYCSDIDN